MLSAKKGVTLFHSGWFERGGVDQRELECSVNSSGLPTLLLVPGPGLVGPCGLLGSDKTPHTRQIKLGR